MGRFDFGFFLDEGDGVVKLIGSFTLVYEVSMVGLLCLTYNIVGDVSLWGAFYGVVFCLNISTNFLVA